MNLANKLTISRIILTFVFMCFFFMKALVFSYLALLAFMLAALTDYYDGKIARGRNQVTTLGKLLDPIADKILMLSAFLAFVEKGLVPAWMVVMIITRELVITGIRLIAATNGKVIPAEKGGKHKTVSQVVAIFIILAYVAVRDTILALNPSYLPARFAFFTDISIYLLMLITVALTLASGISFLWHNRNLILIDGNNG